MSNHTAQATAYHACAEDGASNFLICEIMAEIFGGIGGWHVVGLGFCGVVMCVPR